MFTVVSSARLRELEESAARCAELVPALERERATVAAERIMRESGDALLRTLLNGLLSDRAVVARGRELLARVPLSTATAAAAGAALHPDSAIDALREADGPDETLPSVAVLSDEVLVQCRRFAFGDRMQYSRNVGHARRLAQQGRPDPEILAALARGGTPEA